MYLGLKPAKVSSLVYHIMLQYNRTENTTGMYMPALIVDIEKLPIIALFCVDISRVNYYISIIIIHTHTHTIVSIYRRII